VIRGLSIGDGTGTPQKVYLEVDSDKICYVTLPNGTLLISTSGVINYDWEGDAGAVRLIVPKETDSVSLSNSTDSVVGDYSGVIDVKSPISELRTIARGYTSITSLTAEDVFCYLNAHLTELIVPNAINVYAASCALTEKSIGDFLIAASVNNPTANGSADFSGVTNPLFANIALYMHSIGVIEIPTPPALSAWLTANLSTWSLTFRLV